MTNPHLAAALHEWPGPHPCLAVLGLHGRGQNTDLVGQLRARTRSTAHWVAPQAAGGEWYPFRFMAPIAQDDPWLPAAMAAVDAGMSALHQAGFERVVLVGFSQGACLAAHWALTRSAGLAGLAILTGGYIGEAGEPAPGTGRLDRLPVLITTRADDAWVPAERVRETEQAFRARGADVTALVEPVGEHAVSERSIDLLTHLLAAASAG